MSETKTVITSVSFSSGGARATGNIGVLTRLLETDVLRSVKAWYGCSAGAFCAFLGALGVTPAWCRDCCTHFDLKYALNIQQGLVLDFMKTWGVSSGTELIEFLGSFVNTWEPDASTWTFADLARERPGIFLGITATNLSTRKLVLFSVETHPEMLILDAIRASCSIPFVYVPWISKVGELYCDGAVIEQCPWVHIKDKRNCLVIACSQAQIFGDNTASAKIDSFVDYCMRIILLSRSTREHTPKPLHWIAVNNTTIGSLSFTMTANERAALFTEGEAAASAWLASITMSPGTSGTHLMSSSQNTSSRLHQQSEGSMSDSHRSRNPLQPPDSFPGLRRHTGPSFRRWSV